MRKRRSWDGCIVIPGAQVTAMAATLVVIIMVVALAATLNVGVADVGSMLLGISSVVHVLTSARSGQRPIGTSGTA